jgi:hypothetical protein
VIAQERHQPATFGKGSESVQDTAAVGPPVDVVAQGNDRIRRTRPDGLNQGDEGVEAAVDVADGYRAPYHTHSDRLTPPNGTGEKRLLMVNL